MRLLGGSGLLLWSPLQGGYTTFFMGNTCMHRPRDEEEGS